MSAPLTGKRVAALFVIGFGIVMAVNFYMAARAIDGFSGVVVKNSYVASQEFNGWLNQAQQQERLGWEANISRAPDGTMMVDTAGVPSGAMVNARIRRPLGAPDTRNLTLMPSAEGQYLSADPLPEGRWIVRLTISANGDTWRAENYLR